MRLSVANVSKTFTIGEVDVPVLREVDLELEPGASVAITGPSGSGKSTLLHILGTLEPPSSGSVRVDGRDPFALPEPELARFRNESVGFVFQDHHLLPQYTVLENVLVPSLAYGGADATPTARTLIDRVGLGHRLDHRPAQLSGGERQRVAIARALVNGPGLVLCDEPTGNLDSTTADSVADLLVELHGEGERILVVVTHSHDLATRFERRLQLREGRCHEG